MKVYGIEKLEVDDLAPCAELCRNAGWGTRLEHLRELLRLDPDGCFVARAGRWIIGMVTTTQYGDVSYLGTLIVERSWRRRGVGTDLLMRALDVLKRRGVREVRLETTPDLVPFFKRFCFQEDYKVLGFVLENECPVQPRERCVSKVASCDLDELEALDYEAFLCRRRRRLEGIYRLSPSLCFKTTSPSGRLSGYIFVRRGHDGNYTIGPWVSRGDCSEHLLKRVLWVLSGHRIRIFCPSPNRGSQRIVSRYKFERGSISLMMTNAERTPHERLNMIYALGGGAAG